MVYLERRPSPPLASFIQSLWYTCAPVLHHRHERMLPSGRMQMVISLASDCLTDVEGPDYIARPIPASILVGARSRYEVIDTRDFTELAGIVFLPGGVGPWLRHPVDAFFERSVALDSVWAMHELRGRLREEPTPEQKLAALDAIVTERLCGRMVERKELVKAALFHLRRSDVVQTSRVLGVSDRRLRQIFQEEIGLSPKRWSRLQRFQRAVFLLHRGDEVRWDQLALRCGYYDQSHFSNDFRAFSGIDPTTYTTRRGPWRNHLVLD